MPNHIQGSLISTDTHSNKNRNATAELNAVLSLPVKLGLEGSGLST